MKSFFSELRRRNVVRVGVAYAVTAWILIEIASVVLPTFKTPEWVMQAVTFLVILGFPLALIFAWAFEMTPEGLKREKDIVRDESITHYTGRKLDRVIISLLAIALVVIVIDNYVLEDRADLVQVSTAVVDTGLPPAVTSIAVLPFVNMSADPDNEYFADGLAEELLNMLARIKDFRVAGRTSSFAFKDKNEDLRVIGQKLNVATVLEGSVRKSGNDVRITAQLVNVEDGYHLWSDSYDRKLDNIFVIQEDIATSVVTALKQTLLGEDERILSARATDNVEAYTHFLKGRHHIAKRSRVDLEIALAEFERAVELEPGFALAYTGVADSNVLLANYGFRLIDDVSGPAQKAIDRALQLDPTLGDAYASQGLLYLERQRPVTEIAPPLRKAIELNPNHAYAHIWLAGELEPIDLNESIRLLEQAYEIDPLSPVILDHIADSYYVNGQKEKAREIAAELQQINPDLARAYWIDAYFAEYEGRRDDEIRAWLRVLEINRDQAVPSILTANLYMSLGDRSNAEKYIDQVAEIVPSGHSVIGWLRATAEFVFGNPEVAHAIARDKLGKTSDPRDVRNAARFELLAGDYEASLDHYLRLFETETVPDEWELTTVNAFDGPQLAYVLSQTGNKESAEKLIVKVIDFQETGMRNGDRTYWPIVEISWAWLSVGDREKGLKYLRQAANMGWDMGLSDESDPTLDFVREDPEFQAILGDMHEIRAAQIRSLAADGLISDELSQTL